MFRDWEGRRDKLQIFKTLTTSIGGSSSMESWNLENAVKDSNSQLLLLGDGRMRAETPLSQLACPVWAFSGETADFLALF